LFKVRPCERHVVLNVVADIFEAKFHWHFVLSHGGNTDNEPTGSVELKRVMRDRCNILFFAKGWPARADYDGHDELTS